MLTLPEDIIFAEILPRISSIKSLLKFKSVSKTWCSLISSQKFAKTQLEISSLKGTPLAVFILSLNGRYAVGHCDEDDLFTQQDTSFNLLDIEYPSSDSMARVVGCCNGLYCILLAQKHFMLVNPCTRKYHKLPPIANEEPRWVESYGYGESNGDYKVFTQFWSDPPYGLVSKLYSFKTDSWKTVELPFAFSRNGIFLNGKLYWAKLTRGYPYSGIKIETFDLGSEMVGLVELPSFDHDEFKHPILRVIHGCLCLFRYSICNTDTDIWVMKEYGVKKSWRKVLTFPSDNNQDFISYNPITGSYEYLKVKKLKQAHAIGFGIQSLVSPFPCGV